jgi:hypothetical protein
VEREVVSRSHWLTFENEFIQVTRDSPSDSVYVNVICVRRLPFVLRDATRIMRHSSVVCREVLRPFSPCPPQFSHVPPRRAKELSHVTTLTHSASARLQSPAPWRGVAFLLRRNPSPRNSPINQRERERERERERVCAPGRSSWGSFRISDFRMIRSDAPLGVDRCAFPPPPPRGERFLGAFARCRTWDAGATKTTRRVSGDRLVPRPSFLELREVVVPRPAVFGS